ncbi:MAG: IgGFc-binding protein [Myxococcota bacterium]|nr:IgGFc-binding protein [Myxococcota bacterium]
MVALTAVMMIIAGGCSDDDSDSSGPNGSPSAPSIGGGTQQNVDACETDLDCPVEASICSFAQTCVQCLSGGDCQEGYSCFNGCCVPQSCQAGEKRCCGNNALTCEAGGTGWDSFPCTGATCSDGVCTGCEPGKALCDGNTVLQCAQDGSAFIPVVECAADKICANGACMECYPQDGQCNGFVAQRCNIDGIWEDQEDCGASGKNCFEGFCVSPCVTDPKFLSNSGCDYWAVDLDNHWDANGSPYAVIVSNLSDDQTTVSISTKDGEGLNSTILKEEAVVPGQLKIFNLSPRNPNGSGIFWRAYRVQSTVPIIAYQFNPLDNVDVFSNDASLLLPISTFGKEYMVVSRRQFYGGGPTIPATSSCDEVCGQYPGYVCDFDANFNPVCVVPYRGTFTVVAAQADTTVTVNPTVATLAGEGVEAMQAGLEYEYTLQPYQVLNIKSDTDMGDLTGSYVKADKPIGVFGGHEASVANEKCCADHLEQQLFPLNTWGNTYVASKAFTRGVESDYWRILAAEDGTTVTFQPAIEAPHLLNRGQWFEVVTDQDFVITSDKPVMVSQLLASSQEIIDGEFLGDCSLVNTCPSGYTCQDLGSDLFGMTYAYCFPPTCSGPGGACMAGHSCHYMDFAASGLPEYSNYYCQPSGDPALILTPPAGQFRKDYVFLTPDKYNDDYVNIVAPADATVTLDGFPVSAASFTPIVGSTYKVARLTVADGVHTVEATAPIGVTAYGFDKDVSYGYTAGLNLTDL